MVFILDEGSVFKAPIDKVWKLNQSEGEHAHPSLRNMRAEQEGNNPLVSYETGMPDGTWVKHKVRLTTMPPLGMMFDTIEGPMAGSKSVQYYIPKGNETGVTVVGHWTAKGMTDDQVRKAVMGFLDTVFKEDQANLAKMR
jgi:hypothetical protein